VTQAERWKAVERLYHEAAERPRGERAAFLRSACAEDDALRSEVESLLADEGGGFLEEPALDMMARELAQNGTRSFIGRRLGSYEVLSLIGAGGMGEVYRARDTTLGREVALKLLPRELSADPERLGRLDREARLLASLNHPGIATLYGLEESDGQRFLVMELVVGPTLAERPRRASRPIREALEVCRQIAEGLEAAHEKGIVHRDLKPANVMVTPDGRVKILDFGLAKALGGTTSTGLTEDGATREGTVLGTPAYMSPEQARGLAVDRRTDIWAFGCCLYESLSGRVAFAGDTASDTMAAILDKEPDWSALPPGTPAGVLRLLRRCLTKDMRKRLQHIGDARLELEETEAGQDERPKRGPGPIRASPVIVGAALLVALAAGLGSWLGGRRTTARFHQPVTRLTLRVEGDAASNARLSVGGFFIPFALSPDGTRLVLRARGAEGSQLYLRELAGFETRALPGTQTAATPFFSPDGRWVGFWRPEDRILRKVSVSGGPPIEIGPTDVPHTALWGPGDEILFATGFPGSELWSIAAEGGKPQEIVVRDRSEGETISLRARVPGRRDLLVASIRAGEAWLEVLSRETGKRRRLLRGGLNTLARYTPTGHLVYSDADALFAVAVDPERLEPLGAPVPVIHGIDHFYWHSNVALSETGTVVYLPAERVREAELVWLDRAGKVTPVPGGRGRVESFALSPGGRQAAVVLVEGTKLQLWIFDLERGAKRLIASEGGCSTPIFSRDGVFVTYASSRGGTEGLYRRRADGTGDEERLMERGVGAPSPEDWSPDGKTLLLTEWTNHGDRDIWVYSGGKAAPLVASPFDEGDPRFSPDGRFVAFQADDGGVSHVYVQPFPGPGPRTMVSIEEGGSPVWGPDGRQLFYWGNGIQMIVVPLETDSVLRVGRPRVLFEMRSGGSFMITPDARRFLTIANRTTEEGPLELRVILNWFDELERLAPHPPR